MRGLLTLERFDPDTIARYAAYPARDSDAGHLLPLGSYENRSIQDQELVALLCCSSCRRRKRGGEDDESVNQPNFKRIVAVGLKVRVLARKVAVGAAGSYTLQ
jgi:hypothetical protein